MKKILVFFLAILMASSFSFPSNAASSAVTERPDIKIIIDGAKGEYTNTPIIVNGRTLLPLRELLTNLGVPNDDEHIIWNGKESSVTALKDATKLYLRVGSATARINDRDVTLDAPPLNYKGRVYIPARFAGEAFDKVVVWDSLAKRVYMRNTADFNEVKNTLEKSVALMGELKRYKEYEYTKYSETASDGEKIDQTLVVSGITDNENKMVHRLYQLGGFPMEEYILNQTKYTNSGGMWDDEELTEEEFLWNFVDFFDLNDILYAALIMDKNQNDKELRLSGNVSLGYAADPDPTIKVDFDRSYAEIVIEKSTGYITGFHTIDKMKVNPAGDRSPYIWEYDTNYKTFEHNGNYKIDLPAEFQ